MGAVKSAYAANEYMLYHLERGEQEKIKKLIAKYPDIIEQSITRKSKMTPLYRACFNGDLKMATFLVEECSAKVSTMTELGETPLMVATRRNHVPIVRYLLEKGAEVNVMAPVGLTTLEYAILPGYYEIALLLFQRVKDRQLRSALQYQDLRETYTYRYVNYNTFLNFLTMRVEPENVPDFLTKPIKVYQDPVVDPRQSWGQWSKRVIDFKDPPLVQRSSLPEELQPQNCRLGKLRTVMSNYTMSPMVRQKPKYRPQERPRAAITENQLRSGPISQDQVQVRSNP